jgi:Flp pilus assembly protein TadG
MKGQNNPAVGRSAIMIREHKTRHGVSFRNERGSSMVEYSIVFALLMTMLLGIADFSRALYAFHNVSSAAREAARYAAVRGTTCSTAPSSCTAANSASGTAGHTTQADIQKFVDNATPLGVNTKVTATITWSGTANDGSGACSSANPGPGCKVQVQTAYNFNFMFPFVSKSTLTMNSTSQMTVLH